MEREREREREREKNCTKEQCALSDGSSGWIGLNNSIPCMLIIRFLCYLISGQAY